MYKFLDNNKHSELKHWILNTTGFSLFANYFSWYLAANQSKYELPQDDDELLSGMLIW